MTDCWKRSTQIVMGYNAHAIQAKEQPFNSRMYQKAIASILYATLGTRPDIIYAT
jgi:hypothetical protein